MALINYISNILPTFASSRVGDSLKNNGRIIDNVLSPMLATWKGSFPSGYQLRNKDSIKLQKSILSTFSGKQVYRDQSLLETIDVANQRLQQAVPLTLVEVDKTFGKDVSTAGISYDRAVLLQYSELVDFYVRYARKVINYITAAELAALSSNRKVEGVPPKDLEWLTANSTRFSIALNIATLKASEVKKRMADVPKATFNEDDEKSMRAVVGSSKMDPFGFGNVSFPLSIIFKLRQSMFVDRQVENYDLAEEEARIHAYRINLIQERINNGEGDAFLEEQLRDAEADLLVVQRKLAKMEEEYGL